MNRQMWLLAGLGLVLVLVLYFLFLWRPKTQELADINEQIEQTRQQQDTTRARITALEAVRANSAELEAAITAANTIIPQNEALPSALRELQLAANDSGVTLVSISPGRPEAAEAAGGEDEADGQDDAQVAVGQLATIQLGVQISGNYFQLIDFLRRVENPTIVPRGIVWSSASLSIEEYPTLTASLTGQMFARLPTADVADEGGEDQAADGGSEPSPTGTETPAPTPTATGGA